MSTKANTHELLDPNNKSALRPYYPYKERIITTRLGYNIEIRDDTGAWLKEIIWADDNGQSSLIKTDMFFTGQSEIDQITSAFLHHMLTRYMGTTIKHYAKGIELFTSEIIQGKGIEDALNGV